MNFVSFSFLIFFSIVLLTRLVLDQKGRRPYFLDFLVLASLIFYFWHTPWYLLILLATCGIDYIAALKIAACPQDSLKKKVYLFASLSVNLGLLAYFKYSNFAIQSMSGAARAVGLTDWHPKLFEVMLPLGISFYTFESMSYTIDVYRGILQPRRNFRHFLLFISFFPHLVAGPIVRARDFLYQIDRPRRFHSAVALQGFFLMIQGFFMKMVLADNFASVVNKNWNAAAAPGANAAVALFVSLLFSLQIFCDFAGYSLIARGAAYTLGFHLPLNFNYPYIAGTFSEFWRRWHISLSQWIRDYLYLPLNKTIGKRVGVFAVTLLTMMLSGLWHGAAFTFIIWGVLHGIGLCLERILGFRDTEAKRGNAARLLWFFIVQISVITAWIFFRSESVAVAMNFLSNLAKGPYDYSTLGALTPTRLLICTFVVIALHIYGFLRDRHFISTPAPWVKGLAGGVMVYGILTCYGINNTFIYFQF